MLLFTDDPSRSDTLPLSTAWSSTCTDGSYTAGPSATSKTVVELLMPGQAKGPRPPHCSTTKAGPQLPNTIREHKLMPSDAGMPSTRSPPSLNLPKLCRYWREATGELGAAPVGALHQSTAALAAARGTRAEMHRRVTAIMGRRHVVTMIIGYGVATFLCRRCMK